MALTEPLLAVLLVLCLLWIAYRGEKERYTERIRELAAKPSDYAALLAAGVATLRRIEERAIRASRPRPEPGDLPGVQVRRQSGK